MPAVSPVLAARADPATVCGAGDRTGSVCRVVYELTGNRSLAEMSHSLIVVPARIVLVLLLAFVATRLVRRLIRRLVASMRDGRAVRGWGRLRARAPRALAPPDEPDEYGFDTATSVARRQQRAETMGALLRSVSGVVIWSLAVLSVLDELGLRLAPFIAGAGVAGIAVGLGAQSLVKDFLAGVFMLLEDQYGVGDVIDAGSATGVVEEVGLRTTRLRGVDGTVWHIPNGQITRVGNKSQQWSRAVVDLQVAYEADTDRARALIKQAADELWRTDPESVVEEPEVWGIEDLVASGVVVRLVARTPPSRQWAVARELRARVKRTLDEAGIELAHTVQAAPTPPQPARPQPER